MLSLFFRRVAGSVVQWRPMCPVRLRGSPLGPVVHPNACGAARRIRDLASPRPSYYLSLLHVPIRMLDALPVPPSGSGIRTSGYGGRGFLPAVVQRIASRTARLFARSSPAVCYTCCSSPFGWLDCHDRVLCGLANHKAEIGPRAGVFTPVFPLDAHRPDPLKERHSCRLPRLRPSIRVPTAFHHEKATGFPRPGRLCASGSVCTWSSRRSPLRGLETARWCGCPALTTTPKASRWKCFGNGKSIRRSPPARPGTPSPAVDSTPRSSSRPT